MFVLVQLLSIVYFSSCTSYESPQIETPQGKVQGSIIKSRLGKDIFAFRGIRYAQAERFQAPVLLTNWIRNSFYNATSDGPTCPQPRIGPVNEDCLYLNVYTTKLPKQENIVKRPVIIRLNPGGFYSGTGRSNWPGPQYLLDKDIILVTLNYRLATLGFLSIGEKSPGNYGLKDQVAAMKWVKNNIAFFGGDPDCVTLYGYSAGARSITLHMVSPMSKGLFHRGILGSGSALGHYPLPRNLTALAVKQAQILNCSANTIEQVFSCLKVASAEEMGNSLSKFSEFGYDPIVLWSPVIEEDYGQERFLTDDPVKLIKEGKFLNIPIIAGITKNEFDQRAFALASNQTLLELLDTDFEKYAPISFIYERNTTKSIEVSKTIRKFYLQNKAISNDTLPKIMKIYSDSIVGYPQHRTVKLLAEKSNQSVYYYQFTYQGKFSHFYIPGTNTPYGVAHHDDLIYTFYISELFPLFNSSFPEAKMVETYTTILTNFAKTGKPFSQDTRKSNGCVKWDPYDLVERKYLEIGENLIQKSKLLENRYSVWEKLYPL